MQPESQILVPGQTASTAPARAQNRVLRNTYLLLALSMVPTILGAWLGVQFKFSFFSGSPAIGFILFLAIAGSATSLGAPTSPPPLADSVGTSTLRELSLIHI